jgi:FkbM family methyltransferase
MAIVDDLIYDVGLHNGGDTGYYLQCGFRVLAIDANPAMIELAKKTYGEALSAGRLTLINKAISDKTENRTFWVSDQSEWSSFDQSIAKREGVHAEPISVQCGLFSEILQTHGVPYYLKIDIEGSEDFCIKGLSAVKERPYYVSWESTYPRGVDQLRALRDLGYTRFKIIRQTDFLPVLGPPWSTSELLNSLYFRGRKKMLIKLGQWKPFPMGTSGPFGHATPGNWVAWHEMARRWRDYCELWLRDDDDPLGVWFDFHAARQLA